MSHSDEKTNGDGASSNEPSFDFSEMFGNPDAPISEDGLTNADSTAGEDASPAFDFGGFSPEGGGLFAAASPENGDAPAPEGGDLNLLTDPASLFGTDGTTPAAGPVVADTPSKKGKKAKKEKPKKEKKARPKGDFPPFQWTDYAHWGAIGLAFIVFVLIAILTPVHGSVMTLVTFYGFYLLCAGTITAVPFFLWKADRQAVLFDVGQSRQPAVPAKGKAEDRPYRPGLYDYLLGVALAAMSFAVLTLLLGAYSYDFTFKP